MKRAQLLHNPGAGKEEYSKEQLLALIESEGFACMYSSAKEDDWKNIVKDIDFLIVAGGDGTIRKLTKELLAEEASNKILPIALLPMGTANNISKSLNIHQKTEDIIKTWHNKKIKNYDVGKLYHMPESNFFLESFGYGIFPYLMLEMEKQFKDDIETPELKLQAALELLHKIILSYQPKYCKLEVDGTNHSGKYLLAEIMNTRSIGPNLFISPYGDPGDGELEVILVPEAHKNKFAEYVANKINGVEETYSFHTLKAKNIKISWHGTHAHVDDEIVKLPVAAEVVIELKRNVLQFIIP